MHQNSGEWSAFLFKPHYMTYSERLKNPKWQRKRLEIMERDGFACVKCGNKKETLNVHHVRYKRNTDPWDYSNINLITLCVSCHGVEHAPPKVYDTSGKYTHLITPPIKDEAISKIDEEIFNLQNRLKLDLPFETQENILKELITLQDQRKSYGRK